MKELKPADKGAIAMLLAIGVITILFISTDYVAKLFSQIMGRLLDGFVQVKEDEWYAELTSGVLGKQSGNLANSYSIDEGGQMYRHTSLQHKEVMIKLQARNTTKYYIISSGLRKIYE